MQKFIDTFKELYSEEEQGFIKALSMLEEYAQSCKALRPLPTTEETVSFKLIMQGLFIDGLPWHHEAATLCEKAYERLQEKNVFHTKIQFDHILSEPLKTGDISIEIIEVIFNALADAAKERFTELQLKKSLFVS